MKNITRHKSITKNQMQRIEDVIRHASDLNAILEQNKSERKCWQEIVELKEKRVSIESLVRETDAFPM